MPTKISFKLSAGDAVVGGFAIAALLREYPDMQLQIGSQVPYLWKYNRNCIATLERQSGVSPAPNFREASAKGLSYPQAMTQELGKLLNLNIPYTFERPIFPIDNYLYPHRLGQEPTYRPFVVVTAGIKNASEIKAWGIKNYQEVVDRCVDFCDFVQVGLPFPSHHHVKLKGPNVIDMIGRTPNRKLLRLISCYLCYGSLGSVSYSTWLAQSCNKHAWVLSHGLEPETWVKATEYCRVFSAPAGSYACPLHSCFRHHFYKGSADDNCLAPLTINGETVSACSQVIKPETVANAIMSAELL